MLSKRDQSAVVTFCDWDNTLMSSYDRLFLVHQNTADELLKKYNIELIGTIPKVATKIRSEILSELFGEGNLEISERIFKKHYDQIFSPESLGDMQMFNYAEELIAKLADAKQRLVFISSHYEFGKPGQKDGIREHLDRKSINSDHILVIGIDTLKIHGYDPAKHAKPNITSGLLALELLGINPLEQTVRSVMLGDGKSDIAFARNMHDYLQKINQKSFCQGILFNSLLDGGEIFSQDDITKFVTHPTSRHVTMDYGKFFASVRNLFSPAHPLKDDALIEQKAKLRSIPTPR